MKSLLTKIPLNLSLLQLIACLLLLLCVNFWWAQSAHASDIFPSQPVTVTLPGNNSTGVRFDVTQPGFYTITYAGAAYGDPTGWSTLVNIFKNREVAWAANDNGNLMPTDFDGYIGFQGLKPTRDELIAFTHEEAEPVQFHLQEGDYLTFIGIDEQQAYFDNEGEVELLITHSPITCTVTSTNNAGGGTLRSCMQAAVIGTTIDFDPTIFPPTAPVTISVAYTLPIIITDSVTIDGSMAGVVLDGSLLPDEKGNDGLRIHGADGVVIRGLQIVGFPRVGIVLKFGTTNTRIGGNRSIGDSPLGQGNLLSGNGDGVFIADEGTDNNLVLGNNIGLDISGEIAVGNLIGGITIGFGASNNVIGSAMPNEHNLISGNPDSAILIQNPTTTENRIIGNLIGTNNDGSQAVGSQERGIIIINSPDNVIGGPKAAERNTIGSSEFGILLQGSQTTETIIQGNYVGVDVAGTSSIANGVGIVLIQGAQNNLIGGDSSGTGNLISGNETTGVAISGVGSQDNRIYGNYIGVDKSGTKALPNGLFGVSIESGAHDNQIGGPNAGAGNVLSGNGLISGNGNTGIRFIETATMSNTVQGNIIGPDASGMSLLPNSNQRIGISIDGPSNNLIGGSSRKEGNLISGHLTAIWLVDSATTSNRISANLIGSDINGQRRLPNGFGILLDNAPGNIIGGTQPGQGNLISGNNDTAVALLGTDSINNRVEGNLIGVNISGTQILSNTAGIQISDGASMNFIGGNSSGSGNLISGHTFLGIGISGSTQDINNLSTGNIIQGNQIGTDITGQVALANKMGIALIGGTRDTKIGGGTPESRNLVSGNTEFGILIQTDESLPILSHNQILGNYIGVNVTGEQPLGNQFGIYLDVFATDNMIGGLLPDKGNLISGNLWHGIVIRGGNVTRNTIQNNRIGTDYSGSVSLANGGSGIFMELGASRNTVGISNTIAYNLGAGIYITGTETIQNTITRNSIHSNKAGNIEDGLVRGEVNRIELTGYDPNTHILIGQTCPNCTVEVFATSTPDAHGMHYLNHGQADGSGQFAISVNPPEGMPYLTATTTQQGTTGGFSASWPPPIDVLYLPWVTQ